MKLYFTKYNFVDCVGPISTKNKNLKFSGLITVVCGNTYTNDQHFYLFWVIYFKFINLEYKEFLFKPHGVFSHTKIRFVYLFPSPPPDMCGENFALVSIGGWGEGEACADPGAKTPIGAIFALSSHPVSFIKERVEEKTWGSHRTSCGDCLKWGALSCTDGEQGPPSALAEIYNNVLIQTWRRKNTAIQADIIRKLASVKV